ncbi:MAG: hypothetical protein CMH30_04090 [Micavibrio sp.]|nr:hypothetical protein [Micavibrio sp.]|tara:strand:+ start:3122 stop:3838 length:717 start_codon:yes stop_codon:yes gene_type:complete
MGASAVRKPKHQLSCDPLDAGFLDPQKAFQRAKKQSEKYDKKLRNKIGRRIRRADRAALRDEVNDRIRQMSVYERIAFRNELAEYLQEGSALIAGQLSKTCLTNQKNIKDYKPYMSVLENRLLNTSPVMTLCFFPENFSQGSNHSLDQALDDFIEKLNYYCNQEIVGKNSTVFSTCRIENGEWIFEVYGEDFNEGFIYSLPYAHRITALDKNGNFIDMDDGHSLTLDKTWNLGRLKIA